MEILYNLEILCFMDILKVDNQFKFLKDNFKNGNETKIFEYFEKYWIKKRNIFNYSDIIKNLINCKNLYIKKEGNRESENILIENIHQKIGNHLPKSKITKNNFRDTINYILNRYAVKKNKL